MIDIENCNKYPCCSFLGDHDSLPLLEKFPLDRVLALGYDVPPALEPVGDGRVDSRGDVDEPADPHEGVGDDSQRQAENGYQEVGEAPGVSADVALEEVEEQHGATEEQDEGDDDGRQHQEAQDHEHAQDVDLALAEASDVAVLHAGAAQGVQGAEVDVRVGGAAQPAPLVLAVAAGHVVAARHLLHQGFALLALLDVIRALQVLVDVLDGLVAGQLGVRLLVALEAQLGIALGAADHAPALAGADDHRALGVGAPLEAGVFLDHDVFQEGLVLVEDGLAHVLPDDLGCQLHRTVRAGQALHAHVEDLLLEVGVHALQADVVHFLVDDHHAILRVEVVVADTAEVFGLTPGLLLGEVLLQDVLTKDWGLLLLLDEAVVVVRQAGRLLLVAQQPGLQVLDLVAQLHVGHQVVVVAGALPADAACGPFQLQCVGHEGVGVPALLVQDEQAHHLLKGGVYLFFVPALVDFDEHLGYYG